MSVEVNLEESGFFDAEIVENPQTHEMEYDRLMTASSFNNYFKGIVEQNGVFKNVYGVDAQDSSKIYAPFQIDAGTEGLSVFVHAGKALVYGHWVEIQNGVTLQIEAQEDMPDMALTRRDGVVLRYNHLSRTMTIAIKKGTVDTMGLIDPIPAGYNESTKKFVGLANNTAEIMLGWIDLPPNATRITQSMITPRTGFPECPWISHLVLPPTDPDVDTYLATMKLAFDNWFRDTQDRLSIATNIVRYHKKVYARTDIPATVNLKNETSYPMTVMPTFEDSDYTYQDGDIITIYYNGLSFIGDPSNTEDTRITNYYTIDTSGEYPVMTLTWSLPVDTVGNKIIPKGNLLDIVIERSGMGGIENCINKYY